MLPGCYLGASFYCCYILQCTITIGKEGCYLGVTLVLPSTTATKTHTISPTFQENTKVTHRGVTWLLPSVTWLMVYSVGHILFWQYWLFYRQNCLFILKLSVYLWARTTDQFGPFKNLQGLASETNRETFGFDPLLFTVLFQIRT